ncbi:hypothetical protein RBG61_05840 [Paludicola sp. MB14-C6]|uniref:hypothetical protein n=1 Tax=Paludihabitans sp. MB14-C6 TaxID=3070656 RepID=UPI0027DB6322|nr:hypothetical protein [Paludicola sp. MB14-C6]WMJ24186.1 hypothetical protein RBG61_05840 [Paludicola sp. MB14-C6]
MNYILEIKAFNDLIELEQLSAGQIALWYALMHINNKCGWKEWFTVPNQKLILLTGLTRQSIVNARKVLIQINALSIKTNGTNATSYHLISLQQTYQTNMQSTLQETLPLIKQNNNSKKKKNTSYDVEELDTFWDTVPKL